MMNSHILIVLCDVLLKVQFEVSDCTKREFQSARFDAVYSRDTILHIEDKKSLFTKILVSSFEAT